MMKNAYDAAHAHPDMELDAIDYPSSGPWDGQVIDLNPGAYKANWEFKKKEKGKYKGCKIRTYGFTFTKDSEKSMAGLSGEFTIHSRVSGESIRTKIDAAVDQDGDGKFGDDEVLLSSGKEGYRVRNSITDFTSEHFVDALNLRQIKKSGQLSFDVEPIANSFYEFIGGDIFFKNSSQKKDSEFAVNFFTHHIDDFIVC